MQSCTPGLILRKKKCPREIAVWPGLGTVALDLCPHRLGSRIPHFQLAFLLPESLTLMACSFLLVDKATFMVGSYGPRPEEYEFLTPVEEAPKGMLARGTYHNKSFFTDDDKQDHLTWEWNLAIKKDWTE